MNNYRRKIVSVLACAILAALFIVIMRYAAPNIAAVPETEGEITYSVAEQAGEKEFGSIDYTAVIGKDVTAVRINDLGKLNKITKVNYVADEFVPPNSLSPDMQVVDLTKPFEFAERGTLIFLIMNLDPESEDFREQSDKLAPYKIGDDWHFTLSLPKIFNASNVYLTSSLVARNGEIENYDFTKYNTNYDKYTDKYKPKVARTEIDLKFYTRRQAMNLYQMVTVHYQSAGTVFSGIGDCPLIGTESAVTGTLEKSQNLLIAFAVLAAVVFVVLIVLSLLKRTRNFLNAIIWILGIVLMLYPKFMLGQVTIAPLFWEGLSWSAVFLTLGGALMAIGRNFGKAPTKYIYPAITVAGWALAFAYPFAPFAAARVLRTIFTVIRAAGALVLMLFIGLATFVKDDKHTLLETSTVSVIAVGVMASAFMTNAFPVYINSLFWLCVFATVATFVGVFMVFMETERANAYLTANLHAEVGRQIKDIKTVIEERDNLLRFVSHDMKKPLQFSASLLDVLIEREKDEEQAKALKIVKQNNSHVISNLSEIGSYARFNYIAEPSGVADLSELCASLCEFHRPDCNANGIILKNLVDKHLMVFVKKQGLENAVSNIIINAVEHANCNTITLSAATEKNRIVLSVADNGKGISESTEIFKAYSSGKPDKAETGGVGLFICNNIIESMNGKLTYENGQPGTVFHISLLKA